MDIFLADFKLIDLSRLTDEEVTSIMSSPGCLCLLVSRECRTGLVVLPLVCWSWPSRGLSMFVLMTICVAFFCDDPPSRVDMLIGRHGRDLDGKCGNVNMFY